MWNDDGDILKRRIDQRVEEIWIGIEGIDRYWIILLGVGNEK
jgi:hypothetical protein